MYMLQRCFNIRVGDSEEEFVSDRKRKFGEAAEGKERQLSVSCDLFFSYSRGIISSRQNLREEEEERNYECIQERCCNGQLLGINFPYCRFMYALQVNVCGMEPSCNKKGRYQCATEYSEIEVSRHTTYEDFAAKAAFAVGCCENSETGTLSLYRPSQGSRIPNDEITNRDGCLVPWSLGAYLSRARKGAENMVFGVGFVGSQPQQSRNPQPSTSSVRSQPITSSTRGQPSKSSIRSQPIASSTRGQPSKSSTCSQPSTRSQLAHLTSNFFIGE